MSEREDYELYIVRPLTLILDNEQYTSGRLTQAALDAVENGLGYSQMDADTYAELYRNRRDEIIPNVGVYVADAIDELIDEAELPEPWKSVLTDLLDTHTYTVRWVLGEHYLPEPEDVAEHLGEGGDDES